MTGTMTATPSQPRQPASIPDDAPRSDDGFYWWDGAAWQLTPNDHQDEPEPTFNPWGSGFDRDVSAGDPVLGSTSPAAAAAAAAKRPNVDTWAWVAALAPILAAVGFFVDLHVGVGAYVFASLVAAVAVRRDTSRLRGESYVDTSFGSWMALAVLLALPLAGPMYLHRRAKVLDEESGKVLTAALLSLAAAVFAIIAIVMPAQSVLGELFGDDSEEVTILIPGPGAPGGPDVELLPPGAPAAP